MCGFVGYINKKKKDKKVIKEMSSKIIHRGPDSEGLYMDKTLHMAFRRLSIIDLEGGSQPIYNETKNLVILFNGEIYNFMEIKEDLEKKGHIFTTKTDTEVILHGYEEYGEHILDRLRGMYAFVIYNIKEESLFGARDIFGIKPFYYALMNDTFMFGSEIKSFLPNPEFTKEVNKEALKTYLTFQYNPLEETFFKNVYKLKPGHFFKYKDGNLEIKPYFEVEFTPKKWKDKEEDLINLVDSEIKKSVDAHKISDVKVGAFLSSGIDSSYIVSVLKPNETFTVGFNREGFNEIEPAENLSNLLNIKNVSKIINAEEFFNALPKVQYHSDEPHANLSAVPLYFLSELTTKDVTVVLSGEGADELFGGYESYPESAILRYYRHLPRFIRHFNGNLAKKFPNIKGKSFLLRGSETLEESYIGQAKVFHDDEANNILTSKYQTNILARDITKPYFDKVKKLDEVTKKQYLDMFLWLPNDILLKADKMTMAHSLELRVPYLDKEILKIAVNLPKKYKIKNHLSKYVLRKASSKEIPEEWFKRPKKGFLVPFKDFIREERYYNIIKEEFNSDYAKEFFNTDMLIELLDNHYHKKALNQRKIYTVYSFLLWYKEYFINN
ncbi:MAG: asparagine synthase (glutamine-hydrolyzing) [Ruminococcus sp.]|nr:asparagine synthase (glutamine-hydrolyzing) [Ruminococcus sp.]